VTLRSANTRIHISKQRYIAQRNCANGHLQGALCALKWAKKALHSLSDARLN
jgi:hypothetical protein